jgi:hypothetical protein
MFVILAIVLGLLVQANRNYCAAVFDDYHETKFHLEKAANGY